MVPRGDIEAWRLFVRVVEQGQLSAVAHEEGMDPSTVSRRLSQLEEHLGFALLYRTTRTLQPTPAGAEAYEKVKEILRGYDDFVDDICSPRLGLSGSLRLSTPSSLAEHFLADWLMQFQEENPRVRIQLFETDRVVDPFSDVVDIALRTGSFCEDASISHRIGMFARGMSASPAYLRRFGIPETPDDLIRHRVLRYSGGMHESRLFVIDGGRRVELTLDRPWMMSKSIASIHRAALAGHGIQITTAWHVCGADIQAGRLTKVLEDYPVPDIMVSAVCQPSGARKRLVKAVVDWIRMRWCETPGLMP